MNIANELLNSAKDKFGDKSVISYYNRASYSIGYYYDNSNSFVEQLKSISIPVHTIALLIFDDNPNAIVAFLSCIKYGVVPLMVSKNNNIYTILESIAPSVIISDDDKVLLEIKYNSTLLHVSEKDKRISFNLIKHYSDTFSAIDSETVAYLGMTSGSSGAPKFVMHGHSEMLFASYRFGVETLKLTQNDILYSVPKMNFTYGLANSLFFSFVSGAPAVLIDKKYSPELIYEVLNYYKPTCFFAVPSLYNDLIMLEENNDYKTIKGFNTIRLFVSSGELLNSEIIKKWHLLTNHYISDSVGCSETGSAFLFNNNPSKKIGSSGVPVNGYHLHLLTGDSFEGGTEGILCVNSESNALGYYNALEETNKKFMNGWVKTGDVFSIDSDGFYWYLGREDNMIKYHGMWVSLSKIEKNILKFQGVTDCCVVNAVRKNVNCIVAFICVKNDFNGIIELKKHLNSYLKKYELPESYRIIDSIPLNINGKKDRKLLAQRSNNIIVTIDGPAKMGKSTVSTIISEKYGLKHVQAGLFYRIIAWEFNSGSISDFELNSSNYIYTFLNRVRINGSNVFIGKKCISLKLIDTEENALVTAEIAKNEIIQYEVLRHIRSIAAEQPVIADGRNMGTDVFPDADLKFYFNGSIEQSVKKWCKENNHGIDTYNAGVKNLCKRNDADKSRSINPLRKPDDAIEVMIDGKSTEQIIEIISSCIDKYI